jgi:hypothetical protein
MFLHPRKIGKTKSIIMDDAVRVLGKCMRRYNPGQFIDVGAAVRSTVDQTIQAKHMFFGCIKNWCDKRTGNLTSHRIMTCSAD